MFRQPSKLKSILQAGQELPLKRVFAGAQYPDDEQLESSAGVDFFGPVNVYLNKI